MSQPLLLSLTPWKDKARSPIFTKGDQSFSGGKVQSSAQKALKELSHVKFSNWQVIKESASHSTFLQVSTQSLSQTMCAPFISKEKCIIVTVKIELTHNWDTNEILQKFKRFKNVCLKIRIFFKSLKKIVLRALRKTSVHDRAKVQPS